MTTAHTPGPWFATGSAHIKYIEAHIGNGIIQDVASCENCENGENGDIEANARLIAAAPELLEALQELDKRLRACFVDGITAQESYDSFYQENVAEVIAKATGGAA